MQFNELIWQRLKELLLVETKLMQSSQPDGLDPKLKSQASSARPSIDATMLIIAEVLSWRATCLKLKVGCVLVDVHNRIIGCGYNGVPYGMVHCTEIPCG